MVDKPDKKDAAIKQQEAQKKERKSADAKAAKKL